MVIIFFYEMLANTSRIKLWSIEPALTPSLSQWLLLGGGDSKLAPKGLNPMLDFFLGVFFPIDVGDIVLSIFCLGDVGSATMSLAPTQ